MFIVLKPQISDVLTVVDNPKSLLAQDVTVREVSIIGVDLSNFSVKSLSLSDAKIIKCDFAAVNLERLNLKDVEYVNCGLITTSCGESSWHRVSVNHSRCTGLGLQTSTLQNVVFTACKLNLANFRFAKLKNVVFDGCDLSEADFYCSELTNIRFDNCTLDRTEFSGSKLKSVDFRSSDVSNLQSASSLAGATIDSNQLITLATLLAAESKIEVIDEI